MNHLVFKPPCWVLYCNTLPQVIEQSLSLFSQAFVAPPFDREFHNHVISVQFSRPLASRTRLTHSGEAPSHAPAFDAKVALLAGQEEQHKVLVSTILFISNNKKRLLHEEGGLKLFSPAHFLGSYTLLFYVFYRECSDLGQLRFISQRSEHLVPDILHHANTILRHYSRKYISACRMCLMQDVIFF